MRRRGTVWPWMRSSWSLSELERLRPECGATLGPFHPSRRPSGLAHLALSDGHFVDHPAQFTHVPSKGFAQFDFTILADQNPKKRNLLVDHLTNTNDHANHLAQVFNIVFLDRNGRKLLVLDGKVINILR